MNCVIKDFQNRLRNESRNAKVGPEHNNRDVQERAIKLKDLRDKLRAKDTEASTPRTPRTQEIMSEYDKFRPKTPFNFKADFN